MNENNRQQNENIDFQFFLIDQIFTKFWKKKNQKNEATKMDKINILGITVEKWNVFQNIFCVSRTIWRSGTVKIFCHVPCWGW